MKKNRVPLMKKNGLDLADVVESDQLLQLFGEKKHL